MYPGSAVRRPPAFSVKPPLRPCCGGSRAEANRQKPQRLVPVRSPLPHLLRCKSGLDTRIHEFRHRVRKGIDHDRLAGGLIFDVCLRAVEDETTGETVVIDALTRPVSYFVNTGIEAGFAMNEMDEWRAEGDETLRLLTIRLEAGPVVAGA